MNKCTQMCRRGSVSWPLLQGISICIRPAKELLHTSCVLRTGKHLNNCPSTPPPGFQCPTCRSLSLSLALTLSCRLSFSILAPTGGLPTVVTRHLAGKGEATWIQPSLTTLAAWPPQSTSTICKLAFTKPIQAGESMLATVPALWATNRLNGSGQWRETARLRG